MPQIKNAGKTLSAYRKKFKNTRHFDSFEKLDEVVKLDVKCTIAKHLHAGHKIWYIAVKAIFSKAMTL